MSKLVAVPKSTTISGGLVAVLRRDRIGDPVGADILRRHVDIDADPETAVRLADDQRLAGEITLAQPDQVERGLGHHVGDDRGVDIAARQPAERHQLGQPHRIFVGGALWVGRRPPRRAQLVAGIDGKDDVGVSGIDGEQHLQPLAVKI